MHRRSVLAGMAASLALPAWAQGIRPQSDPYGQVDPYADPRNGFSQPAAPTAQGRPAAPKSPFVAERSSLQVVSRSEEDAEIRMGVASYKKHLKEEPPIADARLQTAMQQFSEGFFAASDRPGLPWEIYINRIDLFQAYAIPGGKLVMFPGTISVADHPAELAAILAHEMGHCIYSHGWKKIQISNALLQQANNGGDFAQALKQLEATGLNGLDALVKSYGRENEFQADDYIILMFERLGVHPGYAVSMYEKMMKYYREAPDTDNSLFSTHPGTLERMQRMIEAVRRLPDPGEQVSFPGWEVLKAAFPTPSAFRNG